MQTLQVFRADVLRNAYAAEFRPAFTDDASVVEVAGHPVCLVPGERGNIKLTAPEDFIVAEALLTAREEAEAAGADEAAGANGREARHAE